MLAWTLTERQTTCALVDADLNGGGLDVLLGIEREPGLCMQDLDAPLGSMDGEALNGELPHWEQVRVLAYAPWRGDKPEPWEMQAAVTALAEANQMELVDAGRGAVFEQVPDLLAGMHLVGVELSVLGLARARVHLNALEDLGVTRPLIVGIEPRGADRRSSVVAAAEAASYLGDRMLGPVKSDGALCSSILGGLGIQRISRRNRKTLEQLADEIEAACGTSHFIDSPPSGESWRS